MKVTRFAISVQWGKGHHYFLRTDYDNINEAISKANAHEHMLLQRKTKRGAKPTVHVWERVRSFTPGLGDIYTSGRTHKRRIKPLPASQKPVSSTK